jgi:hypothetical protein
MELFRLTRATIFHRKAWFICAVVVVILPFFLTQVSSSTENPALFKPALAQTTWAMAWLCASFWGLFAAARIGEQLSSSGLGEHFHSAGVGATSQLAQMWLALALFVTPLGLAAGLVSVLGASPAAPDERAMWIAANFQYALLFALVLGPLLALAIAVATRFGSLTGFLISAGLVFYGLYGVGYLRLLLTMEKNSLLAWLIKLSPHYHFADPTERLRYKLGAIEWADFPLLLSYFLGIFVLYVAVSRLVIQIRIRA